MKIIFLDIDWVIIPFGGSFERGKIKELYQKIVVDWEEHILPKTNPECIKNLWEIIEKTWAKIVLSSSWRKMPKLAQILLQPEVNKDGMSLWDIIISRTPAMTGGWRGNEILQWLTDYHSGCKEGWHITEWVAIDDCDAGMSRIRDLNCFIHTRSDIGLTQDGTKLAIEILNI